MYAATVVKTTLNVTHTDAAARGRFNSSKALVS
jgi:hypothetical protein